MEKKKITRDTLIRQIASDTYTSQATVRAILDSLEQRVFDNLAVVNEDNPSVVVKLFEGFNIEAKYVQSKTKRNNLTGEIIETISKIKPKATFTRTYIEKLSEMLR